MVRGEPTAEELAALVTVVAAMAAGANDEAPPKALSAWVDRAAALRKPLPVGPGAWVASGLQPGARTRAGW